MNYPDIPEPCPACGVRTRYQLEDRGGCLVVFLLALGVPIILVAVNWLGSLVGLHLWHWMTSPFPSIPAIARTTLLFSLAALAVVLIIRKAITRRFSGPTWVCPSCGNRVATAASRVGKTGKVLLSILLGFIFLCLGFCGFGGTSLGLFDSGTKVDSNYARSTLAGTWEGTYVCGQSETGMRLIFTPGDNGDLAANFSFYALPGKPATPPGEFALKVSIVSGELSMEPDHWVTQPSGYQMFSLLGNVGTDGALSGSLSGAAGCTKFTAHKTVKPSATP